MEFSDWITQKYIRWRGNRIGNHASVAAFAEMFGASQPLMSEWMKAGGKVPGSTKYINALVRVYGLEVYGVLGLELPGFEERVRLALREALAEMRRRNITDSESPEAQEIINASVERYGVNSATQDR